MLRDLLFTLESRATTTKAQATLYHCLPRELIPCLNRDYHLLSGTTLLSMAKLQEEASATPEHWKLTDHVQRHIVPLLKTKASYNFLRPGAAAAEKRDLCQVRPSSPAVAPLTPPPSWLGLLRPGRGRVSSGRQLPKALHRRGAAQRQDARPISGRGWGHDRTRKQPDCSTVYPRVKASLLPCRSGSRRSGSRGGA